MGLFDLFKSPEPYFMFIDGSKMSPKAFGNFLVTSAEPHIEPMLELLFEKDKSGFELPLARPVLDDPFPAKLYFLGLFLGSSLLYPMRILRVSEKTLGEIFSGVQYGLLNVRMPDGLKVNPADIIQVNTLIDLFSRLVQDELDTKTVRDITNPLTPPPAATVVLLSAIALRYNNGNETAVENIKNMGFYHQNYIDLTKAIDEALVLPMYAIHKTQVKFVQ